MTLKKQNFNSFPAHLPFIKQIRRSHALVCSTLCWGEFLPWLTWDLDSRGSSEHRVCLFRLWASKSTNITDQEQPCNTTLHLLRQREEAWCILLKFTASVFNLGYVVIAEKSNQKTQHNIKSKIFWFFNILKYSQN